MNSLSTKKKECYAPLEVRPMVITVSGNHETDVCFLYFGLDEIKLAHMTPGTWGYYFNIVANKCSKTKARFQ